MKWTKKQEERLLYLRDVEKKTHKEIAQELKTTVSSVKHKYTRLNQRNNHDKHHHPKEKAQQIEKILPKSHLTILETHAGWGNLTKIYQPYGEVLAHDIDQEKIEFLTKLNMQDVDAIKTDSEKEIHRYIYHGLFFDVIDLDPYGFPSRFFPHIFLLIRDGFLFFTFPKLGVQQINKITKEHYRVFWDITLENKNNYVNKIDEQIKKYAMQNYRSAKLIDLLELKRVFRFAYKIKRESALKLLNLKINR